MTDSIEQTIKLILPRDLFLDLDDRCRAEALKAHIMVRDNSGLEKRRARALEGQARFRMMEQGFEEVCTLHGGGVLSGGVIPSSDLVTYQPFMRFSRNEKGVIIGLASMPEPRILPPKNRSRLSGVTLNYQLNPGLDLDDFMPKAGDFFVLFLISRDKSAPGHIEEIAVGVIDSKYETFLMYQELGKFLGDENYDAPAPPSDPISQPPHRSVSLKKNPQPFIPPEMSEHKKSKDN